MISVICPSIRPDRVEIVKKCLSKQTYKDFEFIVDSTTEKPEGYKWAFNRSMNNAIRKAKGELLVSIQDSVWFKPNALEKFWRHYQANKLACVSGVGDQYKDLDKDGKPTNKAWLDPRKRTDLGSFYECNPEDWELNFSSFPRNLIYAIGGFDEEMDRYYGADNVAVAYRMSQVGAKFYLDQTNESFSLQHDRRADWEENYWFKHNFWEWFKKRPVKLDYLTSR